MTRKKRVEWWRRVERIWCATYRDLFASSSFSWYHSNVGGGTAVNWQWSVASSFFSTTRSSGVTTGLGKLLSAREVDKHLRDYICGHRTIKSRPCGPPQPTVGVIKSRQQRHGAGRRAATRRQRCVSTPLRGPLREPNEVSEGACSVSGPSSPPFFFLSFFFFKLCGLGHAVLRKRWLRLKWGQLLWK